MHELPDRQQSAASKTRWKPSDYLSTHFFRRGKTFFGNPPPELILSRKTDNKIGPQADRELMRSSATPSHTMGLQKMGLTNTSFFKAERKEGAVKQSHSTKGQRQLLRHEKSPYLSNSICLKKMMRLLVPVHGPNDSLKQQIKKYNDSNIRNAELLIVKKQESFSDRMRAYSARMGLPAETRLFIFNSRDFHIKEALLRRGWVESNDKASTLFHLKWTYKEEPQDYAGLQEGQFFNHFRHNQELTNKNCLRKNVRACGGTGRPRVPLSYDLQLSHDAAAFHSSYLLFEAYMVFQILAQTLIVQQPERWRQVQSHPSFFKYGQSRVSGGVAFNPQASVLYRESVGDLRKQTGLWQVLQGLYQTVSLVAEEIGHHRGVRYCLFGAEPDSRSRSAGVGLLKKGLQEGNQFVKCLSAFYVVEILKLWVHLEKMVGRSYGFDNEWIVKPAGVSRGSGITITSDVLRIEQLKYGKVVQKYIQRPLLLDCQRKFDIRQWVLVKSFRPLQAFAFQHCYARLSSLKYNTLNYDNLQRHLTNFSQNREAYRRKQIKDHLSVGPVLHSALAEEQLAVQVPRWPAVKQAMLWQIVKTLECCGAGIEQKEGCFQVFGFDVILDQDCRPYILEVNLSPACQKREFLEDYLRDMSEGIVDMLEGGQPSHWTPLCPTPPPDALLLPLSQERIDKVRLIQRWWRSRLLPKGN